MVYTAIATELLYALYMHIPPYINRLNASEYIRTPIRYIVA
jgi:hypothetical protein